MIEQFQHHTTPHTRIAMLTMHRTCTPKTNRREDIHTRNFADRFHSLQLMIMIERGTENTV